MSEAFTSRRKAAIAAREAGIAQAVEWVRVGVAMTDGDNTELHHIKCKVTTPMKEHLSIFCKEQGLADSTSFFFEGKQFSLEATPRELQMMEYGDVILARCPLGCLWGRAAVLSFFGADGGDPEIGNGFTVQEAADALSITVEQVRAIVICHLYAGHIYSTIDDDHFKATHTHTLVRL